MNPPTAQEAREIAEKVRYFSQRADLTGAEAKLLLAYIDHAEKRIEELETEISTLNSALDCAHGIPEAKTTAPAILKDSDGLKQGPDEWEYYKHDLVHKRRIRSSRIGWIVEEQCGRKWVKIRLDLDYIAAIRSESNGWKRVEGRGA